MNTVTKSDNNSDTLKLYYEHVKQIPLLTMEDEQALSKRIQNGDETARSRLIESNLRLVIKIARAYANFDIPLMDLIQEGNIGLMKAAEKFDYQREVRFSTYASFWIKQAVTRSIVNSRRTIRLPHRKEELIKKIQKTYGYLSQTLGREPSYAEIAKDLNISVQLVDDAFKMSGSVMPLEAESNEEDSGSILDIYADETYCPDADILKEEMREQTVSLLEALMEKEKQVLINRFEFFGKEKQTLKDIGENMGISAETVRQIEKRAIRKLRETTNQAEFFIN